MAIKGSLKEAGLADVCQLLALGQKTGCLSVTDRSRFGQIFFDRGRITFATIVNRRDRLGDLLVREGELTHEQLTEAVDAQGEEPDRRLGQLLLERGLIDGTTLTAYIERQIEEAIYYLFTWKRGNFYFEAGKTPHHGEILISVNPESLLLEGARRVDEWSVIEKKIASLDLVFDLDRDRLEEATVELTSEQRAVVDLMNGERSVEEIAEISGLGEFGTGKAIYGLVQAGFARRVGRRTAEATVDTADAHSVRNLGIAFYQTSMLDDAEREFQRVLDVDPHDDRARHYLGLISLRKGKSAEAVRRFSALLETAGPRLGAYLNLAYALRLQRRFPDAIRVLARARKLAPDAPGIHLAEGATLLFSGKPAAAGKALAEYRGGLDPDQPPAPAYYYCSALTALLDERLDEADEILGEGREAYPTSAPLLLLTGNAAERRGDPEAAERWYRQAAEEDPAIAQAHKNLGDMSDGRGVPLEALEHYRRAVDADPELGDDLYTRMAGIHYRRKDRDEAIRCWRRAVELNPDNQVARNHLEVLANAGG